MDNAILQMPKIFNEPVYSYAPGSPECSQIHGELEAQYNRKLDIPLIIGGREVRTTRTAKAVCPHEHRHVLATRSVAGRGEVARAIDAALQAGTDWGNLCWEDRAAIFLKAAELISTKYRYILNAATMLNQSKNVFQAEIDSACEMADFLRFNVWYMQQIYRDQPPCNARGIWNRVDYRPLEGFVFAITPFNFTAIAGNLPAAPALMGNVVLWKPSSEAVLSAYHLMNLFTEAGLPPGVINFLPGPGAEVCDPVLANRHLAGIHFTGGTATFRSIWTRIGDNIGNYRTYPRLVGETGGKDFIVVHASADVEEVATGAVRGAFEYQGQKCSAASRMYVPASLWKSIREKMLAALSVITLGDVRDFRHFMNAVISEEAFDRIVAYIERARKSANARIIFGGKADKTHGYFIEPTVIVTKDPACVTMCEEIFGPVLTIYVYADNKYKDILRLCDRTSDYALTGAVFARDRNAIALAADTLRHAAGNFYINDKPTGAVVGQQPFGGARASGTNDKAGSFLNLLRWTSPRTIKEAFCPATDHRYPFMEASDHGSREVSSHSRSSR
ncbi:MAG: L-glutamate gamma-semialdehyde dehydrogenase [Verrucomicrobia bacterium]|nr:L-glutamate gamma-semialdehyde dehydrogenase [Verrucomicrobiota bacterium]MCG2680649.1 L-glutamate gamma-semialdehyde dehydrogenase [Kiritimatiellia bacterium]MBU4247427.1 L-glutamate gamma-semialdehyde dehydrogenase [Verrucomicrobiota bacterium]MBU4291485.1 L-glutamate gamma-semialdehyde dehydrogenase [Verrucomicrobiota bacterium]MBU4429668.1 L-glutamate gamma-semialdehyde dehydrogenase [Verrucomicrobiota bacterium]